MEWIGSAINTCGLLTPGKISPLGNQILLSQLTAFVTTGAISIVVPKLEKVPVMVLYEVTALLNPVWAMKDSSSDCTSESFFSGSVSFAIAFSKPYRSKKRVPSSPPNKTMPEEPIDSAGAAMVALKGGSELICFQ